MPPHNKNDFVDAVVDILLDLVYQIPIPYCYDAPTTHIEVLYDSDGSDIRITIKYDDFPEWIHKFVYTDKLNAVLTAKEIIEKFEPWLSAKFSSTIMKGR